MPAWSYSALTSYETCPRRFYEERIAKSVRQVEGTALLLGNAAHKVLELRAKTGAPIPKTLQVTSATGDTATQSTEGWEPLMAKLLDREGEAVTERQIALNAQLCETGWFDKDVWVRGVIDMGILRGESALFLDYKTGKRKPDSDQLKLFAALGFHVWPMLERIVTGFLWLKERVVDKQVFTRGDLPTIWDSFAPRLARYEHAHRENVWEPKPSGLCRHYCPVVQCEFNGQYNKGD